MTETLRERQKHVAREAILAALADEVVEHGVANLSLQAVADRAGVSHRTLYNYFESRDVLIAAFMDDVAAKALESGPPMTVPDDFDLVPDAIRHFNAVWDQQGNLARAAFRIEAAQLSEGATRVGLADPNADAIQSTLAELRPDLDAEIVEATAHIMRTVMSGRTWHRLTTEHGVRSEIAAEAAAWAWSILHAAILRGEAPSQPDPPI